MGTVLRSIFNLNQYTVSVIVFYIPVTCFKGSITAKGDLSMEYFWVQRNLMQVWNGCVGYSKITNKLRFVDQVVMELWYRTVRSITLHSSD